MAEAHLSDLQRLQSVSVSAHIDLSSLEQRIVTTLSDRQQTIRSLDTWLGSYSQYWAILIGNISRAGDIADAELLLTDMRGMYKMGAHQHGRLSS